MELLKPLLIFDGDCEFCRRWIKRWRAITGDRVDYKAYQEAAADFPEIPVDRFKESIYLVTPDRKIYRAAEAAFRSLAVSRAYAWPLWLYRHVPGIKPLTEAVYGFVARHRAFFSAVSSFLGGDNRDGA